VAAVDTDERQRYLDDLGRLWKVIGAIQVLSDPTGPYAEGSLSDPGERLREVWEAVQRVQP
jgi:hypothetical protein